MAIRLKGMAAVLMVCLSFLCSTPKAQDRADDVSQAGINERLGEQVALDAVLRDEEGRDVTLRELIDRPTIFTLNYFGCLDLCTPILHGVADVVNRVSLRPGEDFQIITVSFDPEDTPGAALHERTGYMKKMKRPFPPRAWRFLTGEAQSTRSVADTVGFHFRAVGGTFSHPAAIMMLTPKGKVSRYLYGTSYLPADVEMAIRDAAEGEVRPTIAKVLAFCYGYDPESRQYVFQVRRAFGALFLVCIGVFVIYLLVGKSGRGKKSNDDRGLVS